MELTLKQKAGPLSQAQIRFVRNYEPQFAAAVKASRSRRFVHDLVEYILYLHFLKDPISLIQDEDHRLWFIGRLERVSQTITATSSLLT